MFANTQMMGMDMGVFPDVAKTPSPGGPVPMPYPNIDTSTSHVPAPSNVPMGGGGGGLFGGFDPMAWLSMLGGGEPPAAASGGAPASTAPGAHTVPSQTNVILMQ